MPLLTVDFDAGPIETTDTRSIEEVRQSETEMMVQLDRSLELIERLRRNAGLENPPEVDASLFSTEKEIYFLISNLDLYNGYYEWYRHAGHSPAAAREIAIEQSRALLRYIKAELLTREDVLERRSRAAS